MQESIIVPQIFTSQAFISHMIHGHAWPSIFLTCLNLFKASPKNNADVVSVTGTIRTDVREEFVYNDASASENTSLCS